ncbi:hypothetical protein ABIE09_000469 [Lysobacter enzymogenes]
MAHMKQLRGKLLFDSEKGAATEALAMFQATLRALEKAYSSPTSEHSGKNEAVGCAPSFPVLLTFLERPGQNFLGRLEEALSDAIRQFAALLPLALSGPAGGAMSVVAALRDLATRGAVTALDGIAGELSGKLDDARWQRVSDPLRRARLKHPIDGAEQVTDDDWRDILDILLQRKPEPSSDVPLPAGSAEPEPGPPPSPVAESGFQTTQLMGWLDTSSENDGYAFRLSGFVKHPDNAVVFGEHARLDVLGPDGGQLLSIDLDGDRLSAWMLDRKQVVEVPAERARDLRKALYRTSHKRSQSKAVRGRLWLSDGRALGMRTVAVYAGPAVSRLSGECCLPAALRGDAGCLPPGDLESVFLDVPQALAVTTTDDNGYFEFSYPVAADAPAGLESDHALFQVGGIAAPVVLKLRRPSPAETEPGFVFPEPVLLQIDSALILPEAGSKPPDADGDCTCDDKTPRADGSVLEEFKFDIVVRTSDPAVVRRGLSREAEAGDDGSAVAVARLFRGQVTREDRIQWDSELGPAEAVTISHGRILTIKQTWRSDGYSLGDLRYSLPLAPLQKKNIAIIDWNRSDTIDAESNIDYRESLDNYLGRERDINEIVASTLRESVSANSSSGGGSKSRGFGFGSAIGGLFGGSSGGSSSAWTSSKQDSSRDLTASLVNQLRDKTVQSANAVRSQRTSIVQQVTQSESSKVVTETVANRNACHAITVQYYEVLRHLKLDHELSAVRECLFVPLTVAPFDADKALRWKDSLAVALPPPLVGGLAACERLKEPDPELPASIADEPVVKLSGVLNLTMSFTLPAAALKEGALEWIAVVGFVPAVPEPLPTLCQELWRLTPAERPEFFNRKIAPAMAQKFLDGLEFHGAGGADLGLKAELASEYRPGGLHRVHLTRAADAIEFTRRGMGEQLKLFSSVQLPADSGVFLQSGRLRLTSEYSDRPVALFCGNGLALGGSAPAILAMPLLSAEVQSRASLDRRQWSLLQRHLDQNLEHYHKAIWWQMDPDRRFSLLDGFLAPNSGGRSVASVVENRVVAIVGNCLVMPVAAGIRLDTFDDFADGEDARDAASAKRDDTGTPVKAGGPDDLIDLYRPSLPLPSTRVSIPTQGVFAESVMGACNACEKIDDRRNWQYWLHNLPDEPTPIAPINATGHAKETPAAVPTQLPGATIINQMAANPAPDPIGLAAAIAASANAEAFRDLTGTAGTQANARDALARSYATTQRFGELGAEIVKKQYDVGIEAVKAYMAAQTGGVSGLLPSKSGGDAGAARQNIIDDIDKGRIDQQAGNELIARLHNDQVERLTRQGPAALHDSPVVREAIRTGAENGSSIALSDGGQDVKIGPAGDAGANHGGGLLDWLLPGRRKPGSPNGRVAGGRSAGYDRPLTIEVVTAIRAVKRAFGTGEKSRHVLTLNPAAGLVTERVLLGATDLLLFQLEAIRSKFAATSAYENDQRYRIRARGSTASGVGLMPSIDYDLVFVLDLARRSIEIDGTHDGFPSYSVLVNGRKVYDFEQGHMAKSWALLYGSGDVTVRKSDKF